MAVIAPVPKPQLPDPPLELPESAAADELEAASDVCPVTWVTPVRVTTTVVGLVWPFSVFDLTVV